MRSCTNAVSHRPRAGSSVIRSMSESALFESTEAVSISTL
jgi:hypothetical protein